MKRELAFRLIDSYSVEDCLAALFLCAPDMYYELQQEFEMNSNENKLESARNKLKKAWSREMLKN